MSKNAHPTHATISLSAFRNNLDVVRGLVSRSTKIMAVVKSNAYGHGVRMLAAEAVHWGVDYLAVARVDEGLELRSAGIGHPILVFEIAPREQVADALNADLDLTVATIEGARMISATISACGRKARLHVKVDTGMRRLGFEIKDAASAILDIVRAPSLELVGLCSHFATAEDNDQSFAREQLSGFNEVVHQVERQGIEIPLKHMANSAAIAMLPDSHFSIVRPGIMLYGYMPRKDLSTSDKLRPVMSLKSRISQLKEVDRGTSISYGRRFFTGARTRIATVPIGYADGYSRALTNRSSVLIHGKRFPVVGTVCMDHLMVDIGLEKTIKEGDDVTLIGRDGTEAISCWEIADLVGTIPYEVTCMISARVPRVMVE